MARAHQLRAAGVVAFLRAQRADDRELFGMLGELGQVLAELQAGDVGFDLLELAAVGVVGLHVERVGLAGTAAHPQQDAMPAATRICATSAASAGSQPAQLVPNRPSPSERSTSRRWTSQQW